MKPNRDEFPKRVRHIVAVRCGYLCSRPACRRSTTGPHSDPSKAVCLGEAAHIRGAAPGGPRYDPSMTAQARSDIANAIWLCVSCNKLVDRDEAQYPPSMLQAWKEAAEAAALRSLNEIRGARGLSQALKEMEHQRETVRKRDALREAAILSGKVYELMNFASQEHLKAGNREWAKQIHERLDAMKALFLRDEPTLKALHILGQWAGVAVTPGFVIPAQFWEMYLSADKSLADALKRLQAESVEAVPS